MMNEQMQEKVKEIKRSFRLLMNGVTAQSLREKGLDYKLNWGVQLPHLLEMAREYGKDYSLAVALWKEDIRECKILATLIMPADQMPVEVVEIWMEQTHSQEMAEYASFNVYQYLPEASAFAYQWIASQDPIRMICGYSVLSRLFMRGLSPDERGINEFLDQAAAALNHEHLGVRHTVQNALLRFSQLGEEYANIAQKAINLDFL